MTDYTNQSITKTITINALAEKVWQALTNPADMQQWMGEFKIDIHTTWQVGSPITVNGTLYKKPFENKGIVMAFEPGHEIAYSHLSSLSNLEDVPGNYSHIHFALAPAGQETTLTLTITQFATDIIYKHLAFYWNGTLEVLRKYAEAANPGS